MTKQEGRPPIYKQTMKQTAVYLPDYQRRWLESQPGSNSEIIRELIDEKIKHQKEPHDQ